MSRPQALSSRWGAWSCDSERPCGRDFAFPLLKGRPPVPQMCVRHLTRQQAESRLAVIAWALDNVGPPYEPRT